MPRADFSFESSSLPMLSWTTVSTLSCPGTTEPFGKGKAALTWSPPLKTVLMNWSLMNTDAAKAICILVSVVRER